MTVAELLAAAGPDTDSFLAAAKRHLSSQLALDFCVFASVDPASGLETSCEVFGIPDDPARELRIFELEWFSNDPIKYHELARSPQRAAGLRLSTDPAQVRRFVEFGEPNGVHDELRMACVADGVWWGTFTGFRFKGSPAFNKSEVASGGALSDTLARGFRRSFLHAAVQHPGDLDRPPGAFTVDKEGRLVTTTPTAEAWLDTMKESRFSTLARALAVGVEGGEAVSMTVTGLEGPLSFHASPVKGTDDQISVVVEYPRPVELTSLVVDAYGFTPREREIAELVLQGLVTKQIARKLEISRYTVQDHLKSVFAKTGTAARGELCAAIYTRFYLDPKANGVPPGPYGYFLGS